MTKIIACVNPKGGSGKTTQTLNLAIMLAMPKIGGMKQYKVGIADFDCLEEKELQTGSQKSAEKFFINRETFSGLHDPFYGDNIEVVSDIPSAWFEVIEELTDAGCDYIFCDFGGRITHGMLSVLGRADKIFMPLKPEPNDVAALDDLGAVINCMKDSRRPKEKITVIPIGLHANSKIRYKNQLDWIREEISDRSDLYQCFDRVGMKATAGLPDAMSRYLCLAEWFHSTDYKARSPDHNLFDFMAIYAELTNEDFQADGDLVWEW